MGSGELDTTLAILRALVTICGIAGRGHGSVCARRTLYQMAKHRDRCRHVDDPRIKVTHGACRVGGLHDGATDDAAAIAVVGMANRGGIGRVDGGARHNGRDGRDGCCVRIQRRAR